MTAYSHVGVPQVSIGDIVSAGQVVALAPEPDRKGKREFKVRMWHDGLPVLPYDYVGNYPTTSQDEEKYEAPRGR
jgi:murein DD-endopeptidase MepM/ murein hydrolase activator NlpD